jgi:hypothetical protein
MKWAWVAALTLAACSSKPPPPGLAAGVVVVTSDHSATGVVLLDPSHGSIHTASCVSSSTALPQASSGLSGDVVLPSQSPADQTLWLVDRKASALVWVDALKCSVSGQMSLGLFDAQPQDIALLAPAKAYVSRAAKNPTPTAVPGDFDEGDDLLVVNPQGRAALGRIDMGAHASATGGQGRPQRLLLVDGRLYITLGNRAADGQTPQAGRLVVLDTTTDRVVQSVDLPNLLNCAQLDALPSSHTLAIACAGSGGAQSGVALVDTGTLTVTGVIGPAAFGGQAISGSLVTGLSATTFLVGTVGASGGTDTVWAYDTTTQQATKVHASGASGVIGAAVFDAGSGRIFITDADPQAPRVRIVSRPGLGTELAPLNVSGIKGLAPRGVALF